MGGVRERTRAVLVRAWSPFGALNAVDWAQLHAKAWGAAWPIALFVVTPRTFGDAVGTTMLAALRCAVLCCAVLCCAR